MLVRTLPRHCCRLCAIRWCHDNHCAEAERGDCDNAITQLLPQKKVLVAGNIFERRQEIRYFWWNIREDFSFFGSDRTFTIQGGRAMTQ